jgi:hypothetical protein
MRWCEAQDREPGAIVPLQQTWQLARAWWHDRLSSDWQPRSLEEGQAILHGIGLRTPFWNLEASP